MAVCQMTGKKRSFGHNVSHAKNRTNRSWKPNIQWAWVEVNGKMVRKKELGGILNEPLLLLRPNQPAAWLPDRSTVELFYREMGRKPIGSGK